MSDLQGRSVPGKDLHDRSLPGKDLHDRTVDAGMDGGMGGRVRMGWMESDGGTAEKGLVGGGMGGGDGGGGGGGGHVPGGVSVESGDASSLSSCPLKDERVALLKALKAKGITRSDPRLRNVLAADTPEAFAAEVASAPVLRNTAFVVPEFGAFCAKIGEIYEDLKSVTGGTLPTYIPELAEADPSLLGISLCTIDGQRRSFGDTAHEFCLQSCCKPILYGMALEEHGAEVVHHHVGKEPSGRSFNATDLSPAGIPFNPMINMGAIMVSSLIQMPGGEEGGGAPQDGSPQDTTTVSQDTTTHPTTTNRVNPAKRYAHLLGTLRALTGHTAPVSLSGSTYLCEKGTADRNRGLAYIMKERSARKPVGFPPHVRDCDDVEDVLDFYFMACSMQTTCEGVAAMGATLANGGLCPFTGEQVFSPGTVKYVLSVMESCGLYDWSGEGKVIVGLPVKSGVAGLIMIVVPGVGAFSVFSPPLDEFGNSVRGIAFARRLCDTFNFHSFEHIIPHHGKVDPRLRKDEDVKVATWKAIDAAACGDLNSLKSLAAREFDLSLADYDGRTPLHLAAANGHADVVEFLVRACGVDAAPTDRWGHTPRDEAEGNAAICALLV